MKDINELAKKLADFYGIEYIDAPIGHVVIGADGVERSLEMDDLTPIFGITQRRTEV